MILATKRALKAHISELQEALKASIAANEQMRCNAYLVSIAVDGRQVKFTFARNGNLHVVECMATWDTDIAGAKRELLE